MRDRVTAYSHFPPKVSTPVRSSRGHDHAMPRLVGIISIAGSLIHLVRKHHQPCTQHSSTTNIYSLRLFPLPNSCCFSITDFCPRSQAFDARLCNWALTCSLSTCCMRLHQCCPSHGFFLSPTLCGFLAPSHSRLAIVLSQL
jgi:hypothetical protein